MLCTRLVLKSILLIFVIRENEIFVFVILYFFRSSTVPKTLYEHPLFPTPSPPVPLFPPPPPHTQPMATPTPLQTTILGLINNFIYTCFLWINYLNIYNKRIMRKNNNGVQKAIRSCGAIFDCPQKENVLMRSMIG